MASSLQVVRAAERRLRSSSLAGLWGVDRGGGMVTREDVTAGVRGS